MADIFSGAYSSNGGGGAGNKSSHRVEELNGLTWQGGRGLEDSGSGISGRSGMSNGGGGGELSPHRRSYLWKRPTTKPGAGNAIGGGQSGASASSLLGAKSAGSTASAVAGQAGPATPAALETGVTNELFDGSFFADRREDQGAAAAFGAGVGEKGEDATSPPAAVAAVTAAGREGGEGSLRRAMVKGGGAVHVVGGITDGGDEHRFRVRGASFLDDGLEVRKWCLLLRRVDLGGDFCSFSSLDDFCM